MVDYTLLDTLLPGTTRFIGSFLVKRTLVSVEVTKLNARTEDLGSFIASLGGKLHRNNIFECLTIVTIYTGASVFIHANFC